MKEIDIAFLGHSSTGKSQICHRFVNQEFSQSIEPTIGASFWGKKFKNIKLNIWDCSGNKNIYHNTYNVLKKYHTYVIVYDVTRKKTLKNAENWIELACQLGNQQSQIILVGNKTDMCASRKIKEDDGKKLAEQFDIEFIEVSALDGTNIEALFSKITEKQQSCTNKISIRPFFSIDQVLEPLRNSHHKDIVAIYEILKKGIEHPNPQVYFEQLQESQKENLKYHLDRLVWTPSSICCSIANMIIFTLLSLSVFGLFMAYSFGVIEINKELTLGLSCHFFSFGDQQNTVNVINQTLTMIENDNANYTSFAL